MIQWMKWELELMLPPNGKGEVIYRALRDAKTQNLLNTHEDDKQTEASQAKLSRGLDSFTAHKHRYD